MPHLIDWWEKYEKKGLVIIGVHTPEFEFEKKVENVEKHVKRFGAKWPIAIDNDYKTWKAYKNENWPGKHLIGKKGFIRFVHYGEGKYEETEEMIEGLLTE